MPRYSYMGRPLKARPEELEAQSERLHKVLAGAGLGSRRDMEQLILEGRVSINGQPAQVGDKVKPGDIVKLNGKIVRLAWKAQLPRVLIYHKPEGEIVSRDDPEGRPSVFDNLPPIRGGRWITVGRLDFNTEGLLIFTTDGELANRLSHPRYEVEREYAVRLLGSLDAEKMDALIGGIELEDGIAKVESIVPAGGEGVNQWYRLVIKEGRNREVRRLMEHLGLTVSRLIRVRFGPVAMPPRLKRGMKEELAEEEVGALLQWCGLDKSGGGKRETAGGGPDAGAGAATKVGHPYRRRLNSKGERQD
ncbi:MAG: pseudouridine synthase [Betaproteobacteria bacterium]|nr:pseudouridine synthase [Betaproteobacteria bacterium]